MKRTIIIEKDSVFVTGIDFSVSANKVKVHSRDYEYIVLSVPGHTSWYSIGHTKYYGKSFFVYKIVGKTVMDGFKELIPVEEITWFNQKVENKILAGGKTWRNETHGKPL